MGFKRLVSSGLPRQRYVARSHEKPRTRLNIIIKGSGFAHELQLFNVAGALRF